jgi:hypothetical protein
MNERGGDSGQRAHDRPDRRRAIHRQSIDPASLLGASMSEIIYFPTPQERTWPEIEAVTKSEMLKLGTPPSMLDWILADMKPSFLAAQSVTLISLEMEPQCLAPAVELFEWVNAFWKKAHHELFAQILLLELEFYKVKFSPPGPTLPEDDSPRAAQARNRAAVSQGARGAVLATLGGAASL